MDDYVEKYEAVMTEYYKNEQMYEILQLILRDKKQHVTMHKVWGRSKREGNLPHLT